MSEEISEADKGKIAANFLLNSPPGESTEVWQDLKTLLGDEQLVRSKLLPALVKYNKEQLTPVAVEGSKYKCLVTQYNDLGGGRFADPRTQQSFKFDHLMRVASDFQPLPLPEEAEALAKSLDSAVTTYVEDQFQRGSSSVFARVGDSGDVELTVCIEAHHFKSKNFQNGRWRSVWSCTVPAAGDSKVTWNGRIRVQVHHFDDGNVQLLSSKTFDFVANGDSAQFGADVAKRIQTAEDAYQEGLNSVFQQMSGHVRAFRRPLPVFGDRIPWEKLSHLKIGDSLQQGQSD